MFKDKHLIWKTIALFLCIKIPRTKSNLLRIYTYIYIHIYIYATYTYIYICIYIYNPYAYCYVHVYIHNHTYTYQIDIQCVYSLCGAFLFWFYKTQEKLSNSKAIFILSAQGCNIIILAPIHMTAIKYKKFKDIFLFVEINYNNRKHHQTFS